MSTSYTRIGSHRKMYIEELNPGNTPCNVCCCIGIQICTTKRDNPQYLSRDSNLRFPTWFLAEPNRDALGIWFLRRSILLVDLPRSPTAQPPIPVADKSPDETWHEPYIIGTHGRPDTYFVFFALSPPPLWNNLLKPYVLHFYFLKLKCIFSIFPIWSTCPRFFLVSGFHNGYVFEWYLGRFLPCLTVLSIYFLYGLMVFCLCSFYVIFLYVYF